MGPWMMGTIDDMATYDRVADNDVTQDDVADNGITDNVVARLSLPTTTTSWAMGP